MEGLEMFKPAALILSRVISRPEPDRYCLDAGHKAISAEHRQPPEILTVPQFELATHSEEHMAIMTTEPLEIGQELLLVPHHICPTVALHDEAVVVENNAVITHWPISARGRKITI
jgi:D-serine deaminase-like pyridoxal phosphate-dependent protein